MDAAHDDVEKAAIKLRLDQHKMEAKRQQDLLTAQKALAEEESEPKWLVLATDMQATQPVPKLRNQSAYFKTKVRFLIRLISF